MTNGIDVEKILKEIEGLPLKDALTYLVVNNIARYAGDGMGRIKNAIQDKQNEKRYAFVPDKEEAKRLNQLTDDPQYRQIHLLIPKYRYIDLIRTGLLIRQYHTNDNKANRKKVKKIKEHILHRPNGEKLLKIANLPTTPYFQGILGQVYTLKSENYSETQLEEKFDEMVSYWENSSKLFGSDDAVSDVTSFCREQIRQQKKLFLVLGMKHAAGTVESAVKLLSRDNYLSKNGYAYKLTKELDGNMPRVEVMFTKEKAC